MRKGDVVLTDSLNMVNNLQCIQICSHIGNILGLGMDIYNHHIPIHLGCCPVIISSILLVRCWWSLSMITYAFLLEQKNVIMYAILTAAFVECVTQLFIKYFAKYNIILSSYWLHTASELGGRGHWLNSENQHCLVNSVGESPHLSVAIKSVADDTEICLHFIDVLRWWWGCGIVGYIYTGLNMYRTADNVFQWAIPMSREFFV